MKQSQMAGGAKRHPSPKIWPNPQACFEAGTKLGRRVGPRRAGMATLRASALRASILAAIAAAALGVLAVAGVVAQGTATVEPPAEMRAAAAEDNPYGLWQLGDFYRKRQAPGDDERSLDLFRKSADGYIATEGHGSSNAAIVLRDVTTAAAKLGRHEEAIAAAGERVRAVATAMPGSPEAAAATLDYGTALQDAGRFDEAVSAFDSAAALYRALPEDHSLWLGGVEVNRGYSLQMLGRQKEALAAFQASIEAYDRSDVDIDSSRADVLGRIGAIQFYQRDFPAAVKARQRQVDLLRKAAPGSQELAQALYELAQVRNGTFDYALALSLLDEAQALFDALPGKAETTDIDILLTRAISHQGLEQFDTAVDLYRQALARYTLLGPAQHLNRAIAHAQFAQSLTQLARFAEAEHEVTQAIRLYSAEAPGSDALASTYHQQAMIYQGLSRYRDALEPIARARAIFLETQGEMSESVGDTWLTEGISHEGMKEYQTALADYEKARARYAAIGERGILPAAFALNNMAWVYRRMGDYPRSEAMFREVLPILEARLGPTHLTTTKVVINIGILAQLQGDNDEAIRWSMRALTNLNRAEAATLEDQRWTYDTLSKAFKGRDDPKRAILFAKLAINAQQKIRAHNKTFKADDLQEFKQEWRFLYQDLADLLIGQGRLAEAQAVLNMEKEEELSDFVQRDASADLRDSQAPLTPKEDAELAGVDRLLSQPIAAAAALAQIQARQGTGGLSAGEEQQVEQLEALLDDAYASFMDAVDAFLETARAEDVGIQKEVEAINLDYVADTQEDLRAFDGKAAMLQIASLRDATHLFFTVPDASVHREVGIARAELSRLVFEALDAIERRDPAVNEKMQALYGILIAPVADDLRASGAETLMLNLQGFLRYVPFAALFDGKAYLVENYALSLYTPAARTEFATAPRDPARSAGFGVTASHPGFAPLPGVAREIEAIFGDSGRPGALAGAASLDAGFTREAFRAALQKRPEIVHIASHFKLVPGRETDSFLLLGDGSPLSLSDIRKGRGFRFGGVDLLTLSACETARGGDGDGDEVESFGALAQMNGASSVMATLWPVADEATAALMKSFYENMVDKRMSKADALRAAQVEAIRAGRSDAGGERGAASLARVQAAGQSAAGHPYFWSPFVLMGNWM